METFDERLILLKSGSLHVRHGIRWNQFKIETDLKMKNNLPIDSVDIAEAITLFCNIYFGLIVIGEKKINEDKEEREITPIVKKEILEICNVRNRFIHIDYQKTNITNNGNIIEVPIKFAFVQNIKNEFRWILDNSMNIEKSEFDGVKSMIEFIDLLIEKCNDLGKANKYKIK